MSAERALVGSAPPGGQQVTLGLVLMFDAIAGAQRRRFVRAALSIERVCRYAGGVLGPAVPFPEGLVVAGESSRAERDRLRRIPGGQRQAREIGTHAICPGMVSAERI